MKTLSTPLPVIIAVLSLIPAAFAGNPSPRQVEENPALVRVSSKAEAGTCKLCAVDSNSAYRRSPKAIEESPALARTFTCAAEVPVKVRGLAFGVRTLPSPRILETR